MTSARRRVLDLKSFRKREFSISSSSIEGGGTYLSDRTFTMSTTVSTQEGGGSLWFIVASTVVPSSTNVGMVADGRREA